MKNRLIIALLLLLILSTYNIQNNFNFNSKINIEKIIVENNFVVKGEVIKNKLSFLYGTSPLFLKSEKIELKLNEIEFIDSFKIKKIFPNNLKISIFEKKPIAILQNKKQKKYFTSKGDIINYSYYKEFENLPLVFGNKKSFSIFLKNLKIVNFPLNEVKIFYLFESKRWDVVTKNNQTIKLPIKNYNYSLKNFLEIKDKQNFEKYKIFDYRINNQLILR